MTLTERLAERLQRPPGDAERRLAALHMIDWVAAAVAARDEPEARALRSVAAAQPEGSAMAIGAGRTDARTAALTNGGLALLLELDSTHRAAKVHPGPVVIAAALAAAERAGDVAGHPLLDAVAVGYEAMIRVGESVGPGHYRQYHSTATCGPFGAAAAVSRLLGLDRAATADALGNAGTRTGGFWQCRVENAMSKPLHSGGAAEAGMLAADLAARGLTGPREVLEGPLGLYAATCPDPDPGAVERDGSQPWKIAETSLKPWPGCRHTHPAIGAALELRGRLAGQGLDGSQPLEVATYPEALDFADQSNPADRHEAMFSLQHSVAVALLDGDVTLGSFSAERWTDPALARLRARVTLTTDDEFRAAYPGRWGAQVTMRGADGSVTCRRNDAPGDPEDPLSATEVLDKARALLDGAGVQAAGRDRMLEAGLGLAQNQPVATFSRALGRL